MAFGFPVRGGHGPYRPLLPRGVTIGLIAILFIAGAGYDLHHTWDDRFREIRGSRREVANLAWSAARQAEVAFRLADANLMNLVERVEVDGTGPVQRERLHQLIARQLAKEPVLQGLAVLDETGAIIVHGLPGTPDVSLADREFFQHHLTHADRGPYTSEARQSRASDNWIVSVSRRVNHPDGSFAGVVLATVDVKYFQSFYATLDLGHDGSAVLFRDDGRVPVRQPFVEAAVGSSKPASALFRDLLPAAANGTFEVNSPLDGMLRINGYRRVAGFPLVVLVALGESEQLADWRASARQHLFTLSAITLVGGFFAVYLARQVWFAERTAKATNAELGQLTSGLAEARDRAEQASQAKSRFLTGMTHELRTPLHGILGYAELLRLEGGLNPAQSRRVTAMMIAGEHLLDLINAVLDISRIEAGRLELNPVEIELNDFARFCLDVVRPAAEAKGLALVLRETAPSRLYVDTTRLRQVLINLLGNAIKFTPSGAVEVRLARADGEAGVRVEVADTGPGIWSRHRDRLFQTFERLNAEALAGIEGAGLGLALSDRLVRAMGGRIGYQDNPGGGSVFWLELPANSAIAAATIVDAAPARVARPGLRVLVADDDALNRDIASKFLTLGGHAVVRVADGGTAVAAAADGDFDVILMDVRMPGMNGLEATRRIRALPGRRGMVPVIALTAQAFAEQIEICRRAGMNSHVSKPFRQAVLLAAVEDAAEIPAPTGNPPVTVPANNEPGVPVFDRAAFDDTVGCLAPGEAAEHIRTLLARGEALQGALRAPEPLARADQLAAAGHKLAGGAAMLGFLSLAQVGRRFELAADSGLPEAVALADQLATAIDDALAIMRRELAVTATTAA